MFKNFKYPFRGSIAIWLRNLRIDEPQATKAIENRDYFVALLVGAVIVSVYVFFYEPLIWGYSVDSASYIDAARSLLRGEPFLVISESGFETLRLWPPGYPTLLAAVSFMSGQDPALSALWLGRIAMILTPVLVMWTVQPWFGSPIAWLIAIMTIASPGLISNAHLASSDIIFFLVSVASIGFFARKEYILAGVLVGLSYWIRNTALALIAAEATALFVLYLHDFRRYVGFFIAGTVPIGALFLWNTLIFGSPFIYAMPPSQIGLFENIAHTMQALSFDILSIFRLSKISSDLWPLSLIVVATTAILLFIAAWRGKHTLTLVATLYTLSSIAMLVLARSRYQWGELISARHVAQFDWLFVAALLAIVVEKYKTRVVVAVGAVIISSYIWDFAGRYHLMTTGDHVRNQLLACASSQEFRSNVRSAPVDSTIVSNVPYLVRIEFNRAARSGPAQTNGVEEKYVRIDCPFVS